MPQWHTRVSMFKAKPPEERFWSRVQKSYWCWQWTGAGVRTKNGYGRIMVNGRLIGAHQYSYELLVGPIPKGLTIDHLCRNRGCVNPEHLEPVTHRINILRGDSISAKHAKKTHCIHGHPFDSVNTYYRLTGGRTCKTCRTQRERLRLMRGIK